MLAEERGDGAEVAREDELGDGAHQRLAYLRGEGEGTLGWGWGTGWGWVRVLGLCFGVFRANAPVLPQHGTHLQRHLADEAEVKVR